MIELVPGRYVARIFYVEMAEPLGPGNILGVSVAKGHPYWRVHYDNIPVDVHGGLTFGEQLGARYWIGFDCAHYRDLSPAMEARLRSVGSSIRHSDEWQQALAMLGPRFDVYRDLAFVRAEVERLAEQVAAAGRS